MNQGSVWHSEIAVSRREYSIGAMKFKRLGKLIEHFRSNPLMLRCSVGGGSPVVKVILRDAIPKRMLFKIQTWYIPHLHEEDVNRLNQ